MSARWEGVGRHFKVVVRPKEGLIIFLLFDDHKNASSQFSGPLPSQLGHLSKLVSYFDVSSNLFCGDIPVEVLELRVSPEGFGLEEGNGFGTPCLQPTSGSLYAVDDIVASPLAATTATPVMPPVTVEPTAAPATIPVTITTTPSTQSQLTQSQWESAHLITGSSSPSPLSTPSPSRSLPARPTTASTSSTDQGPGIVENHRSASLVGIAIALAIASTAALVASRLTYLLCIDRPWERIKVRTQSEGIITGMLVGGFWNQTESSAPLLSDTGVDSSSCGHGLRRLRHLFGTRPFFTFGRKRTGTALLNRCSSGLFRPIALFVTGACMLAICALKTLDRCLGVCVLSLFRFLIYLNIWRKQVQS